MKLQSRDAKQRMKHNRKKMHQQTPVQKRKFWDRVFGR